MNAPVRTTPEDAFPIRIPRTRTLQEGVLIRRYKRFLADVELTDGRLVTAHCVNTGAMEGLTQPGIRVWVSAAQNPARKLAFTWELAEVGGLIYGVDTSAPNRFVRDLLSRRLLPWLADYDELAAEKRYPGTLRRADFWMRSGEREVWIEVKNCHLVYPDSRAYFPDCVSDRAAAHMRELAAMTREGEGRVSAETLFFVQTPGATAVRPSDVHDPVFAEAARTAALAGVRFSALLVLQTPEKTVIEARIPVDLKPYATDCVAGWREEARSLKG